MILSYYFNPEHGIFILLSGMCARPQEYILYLYIIKTLLGVIFMLLQVVSSPRRRTYYKH